MLFLFFFLFSSFAHVARLVSHHHPSSSAQSSPIHSHHVYLSCLSFWLISLPISILFLFSFLCLPFFLLCFYLNRPSVSTTSINTIVLHPSPTVQRCPPTLDSRCIPFVYSLCIYICCLFLLRLDFSYRTVCLVVHRLLSLLVLVLLRGLLIQFFSYLSLSLLFVCPVV